MFGTGADGRDGCEVGSGALCEYIGINMVGAGDGARGSCFEAEFRCGIQLGAVYILFKLNSVKNDNFRVHKVGDCMI